MSSESTLPAAEAEVARLEAALAAAGTGMPAPEKKSLEKSLKTARRVLKKARRAEERAQRARAKEESRRRPEKLPEVKGVKLVEPKGSTKRLLGYEQLHEDGIMRVERGCYSIALDVDDVNYIGCREEDQAFVVYAWRTYLDGLDHEVHLEVCLKTRGIDADVFYDSISLKPVNGDDAGNELRGEYNAWIREQMSSSAKSLRRSRTVVLSVEAETYREAAPALAHEAERFIRFMRDLGSDARVMDGQQRLDDLCSYTRQDDAPGSQRFETARDTLGLTTLDLAAPTRVIRIDDGRGDARMIVGRRWVKTYALMLDGYGKTMRDSFISDLSSLPYDISITWHVRPWETSAAISAAEAHYNAITEENNAFKKNRSRPERGFFIDDDNLPPAMLTAQREALEFRERLTGADPDRAFGVTTVVCVMGRDEAELKDACRAVEKAFQEHRKPLPDAWAAMREQAFSTALPTGACRVPYDRTLNSEPLSRMLMFASTEIFDDGGLLLGVNADTRSILRYNPVSHEHSNSFVLAEPGQGKSMNVKLTKIIQNHLVHPEDDIIGIDPEGELTVTCEAAGGQVVNISEASVDHVNPLDISLDYDALDRTASSDPVPAKVSFLQSLIHMMSGSVTDEMVNIIDRAGKYIYADWMENPVQENVPTLQDLYDYLVDPAISSKSSIELARLIERYIEGTLNVFNHATTVELSNSLVVFNLSSLSKELKSIALLVILEHVWVRVTANRRRGRRTWLIVDEFQLLLDDDRAVEQFDRFFSRGRKWDFYITAITQNVERVLANDRTYYMLQNSPFVTLFAQSQASAKVLQELLELSDAQAKTLVTAHPGEGLYCFKNKVVHFDFRISEKSCPRLLELCSTSAEELRDLRRRRAAAPQVAAPAPDLDLDEPDSPAPAPASERPTAVIPILEPIRPVEKEPTDEVPPSSPEPSAADEDATGLSFVTESIAAASAAAPEPSEPETQTAAVAETEGDDASDDATVPDFSFISDALKKAEENPDGGEPVDVDDTTAGVVTPAADDAVESVAEEKRAAQTAVQPAAEKPSDAPATAAAASDAAPRRRSAFFRTGHRADPARKRVDRPKATVVRPVEAVSAPSAATIASEYEAATGEDFKATFAGVATVAPEVPSSANGFVEPASGKGIVSSRSDSENGFLE